MWFCDFYLNPINRAYASSLIGFRRNLLVTKLVLAAFCSTSTRSRTFNGSISSSDAHTYLAHLYIVDIETPKHKMTSKYYALASIRKRTATWTSTEIAPVQDRDIISSFFRSSSPRTVHNNRNPLRLSRYIRLKSVSFKFRVFASNDLQKNILFPLRSISPGTMNSEKTNDVRAFKKITYVPATRTSSSSMVFFEIVW